MINKKLLAVASIATVLSASSAFAKTEGSYFGINANRSSTEFSNVETSDLTGVGAVVAAGVSTMPAAGTYTNSYNKLKADSNFGAGASYKYAINFGGFYVAPGLFAESINAKEQKSRNANYTNIGTPGSAAGAAAGIYQTGDKFTTISENSNTTVESKYRYGIK